MRIIPGTTLKYSEQIRNNAFSAISPVLEATGGLTLSQLSKLTGIEGSTIQNWIKRGWVSSTIGKKYRQRQIIRIILINMLRGVMKLEDIARLMKYVNGDVEDSSDDIIDDVILYNIVRFNEKKVQESELHIKSENNIKKTNLLENPDLIYDTGCNKFIKTSFLVENNLEFVDRLYEDIFFSMQVLTKTKSIGVYNDTNYYWRKRKNTNKSVTQKRTDIKNIKDRIFIIKEVISLFENSEYNFIMDNLYKKLLEIDFRLYINQIDRANDEYKKVILDEMLPILKTIPDNVFENLNSLEKIKYDLLLSEKIDELEYLTSKQREHKKLKKQNSKLTKKTKKQKDKNKKLKKEIKVLKSTKGWIKYKLNNIYNRLFK